MIILVKGLREIMLERITGGVTRVNIANDPLTILFMRVKL
jgi:hypothetical protein